MIDLLSPEQRAAREAFIARYRGFRVDVPEGHYYLHEIKRHTINAASMAMHNGLSPDTDRFTETGIFTGLHKYGRNGNPYTPEVIMSDHLCEVADHQALVDYAKANAPLERVLINGLGLGVAIELLAPYVKQFTIIELEIAVIRLVAPHYQDRYPGRIEIVQHNALSYKPTQHYDAVFHDIWTYIDADNLRSMNRLEKKWAKWCDWQESWARVYCQHLADESERDPLRFYNALRSIQTSADGKRVIFVD